MQKVPKTKHEILQKMNAVLEFVEIEFSQNEIFGFSFLHKATQSKSPFFTDIISGIVFLEIWLKEGIISEDQKLDLFILLINENNIINIDPTSKTWVKFEKIEKAFHSLYVIMRIYKNKVKFSNIKNEDLAPKNNVKVHIDKL